jgi:hypothetical protein
MGLKRAHGWGGGRGGEMKSIPQSSAAVDEQSDCLQVRTFYIIKILFNQIVVIV